MSRSVIIAILAFGFLILANLALFAFLSFGPLSQKVVTEKLVHELNDARSVMRKEFEANPLHHSAAKKVAPMLRRFERFQAILLLDSKGQVVHRQQIHEKGVQIASNGKPERRGILPVQTETGPGETDPNGILENQGLGQNRSAVALEYDPDIIENEVREVRRELLMNLIWGLVISVILLITGGAYVIHAYKRNKAFEIQARKADKLAYVGTLAAGLAHEIRNPLNSMNMNLQLIREDLMDIGLGKNSEIDEMFNGTSREINRLSKLVSSFLAYARPAQLALGASDINVLIQDLANFISPEIQEKKIKLDMNLDENLPPIPIDEGQLRQALLNIIQNAVQVLQKDQCLHIETRRVGSDNIIIVIEDEGPGIAEEGLEEISKVFYSTKKGGTGLGIPIAQRIAELHGGGLKIESQIGKGTRVTFVLPLETPKETS